VRPLPGGRWWSDINPAAHRLARAHVLASPDAIAAWDRLAAAAAAGALPFAVHVWVAGREATVCAWDGPGGVADMAARLPAAAVREFPGAGHSIHNSAADAFHAALVAVIDAAASAPEPPAVAAAARGATGG
jgi:pimeloyl-ACP methyl ester carboxylesterase